MAKTLWILTEERPKKEVVKKIISIFSKDNCKSVDFKGEIKIIPIFDEKNNFSGDYQVEGVVFNDKLISKIILKIISGNSSFVDYLIYLQAEEPLYFHEPLYAIEETKTDDSESRNTGVFQRITKFVYVTHYYPNCKKIMLYNLQVPQKEVATPTNNFGNRLLLTLGVKLEGKSFDTNLTEFTSVDELISDRNAIRPPPAGNVPINIFKCPNKIQVSGRLVKSNTLSHDPNIGALSGITACIRKLGYEGPIELIKHGLSQEMIKPNNKFMRIVNKLNLQLDGLQTPQNINWPKDYWKYEKNSEKIGSIFLHLIVKNFSSGYSIFENHAGGEKGYFLCHDNKSIPIAKYKNRDLYKNGDKNQIIHIPDLVLLDPENKEIINIEAKQSKNSKQGIIELKNFDAFEEMYIKKYYPDYKIIRTVILFGNTKDPLIEPEISFILNQQGVIRFRKNIDLISKAMHNTSPTGLVKLASTKNLNPDS